MQRNRPTDPWGCDGKEPFQSLEHARRAAKRGRRHHRRAQVYRCGRCGNLHIGGASNPHQRTANSSYRARKRTLMEADRLAE